MDIQMPEMDGVSATKQIRALGGRLKNLPIIAVTANSMKGDRERYLKAGLDDYVSKPIERTNLSEAMFRQTAIASDLDNAIPVADSPEAPDLSKDVDALFRDLDLDD
jgi:CheY-like chemotaxis protein